MDKQHTAHFPTAKIKKMIQMNQDIGKLSNSIPHLLQHTLQIFLNDVLTEVDKIAIQEDCNKLTPSMLKTALNYLKKYKFLDSTISEIQDSQPPKRKRPNNSQANKQSKPRKKKKSAKKQELEQQNNQDDDE